MPGLWFNPVTRIVGGTPTEAADGVHAMTYRVEDSDGDFATLTFEVRIDPADTEPSFGAQTVADQAYTVDEAILDLILPAAASGNGALSYTLRPTVPGLTFDLAPRTLSGTPTEAGTYAMTYTVTDTDGDTDTLTFTVTVNELEPGLPPALASESVRAPRPTPPASPGARNVAACISVENTSRRLYDRGWVDDLGYRFTNLCNEDVTVYYCDPNLNPHNRHMYCGTNYEAAYEGQPYYTIKRGIDPGESISTYRIGDYERGELHWAACLPFPAWIPQSDADGNYWCKPRHNRNTRRSNAHDTHRTIHDPAPLPGGGRR